MKKILALAILTVLFAGCKKDDDKTTTPTPVVKSKYISCSIDGVKYTYTDGVSGYESSTGYADFSTVLIYSASLSKDLTGKNELSIFNFVSRFVSGTNFKTYFGKGNYEYFYDGAEEGPDVIFNDADGVPWDSYYGDNSFGSNFKITSSTLRRNGSNYFWDVEGTFNCELGDDNGNYKTVTNGKFYLTFANQ